MSEGGENMTTQTVSSRKEIAAIGSNEIMLFWVQTFN